MDRCADLKMDYPTFGIACVEAALFCMQTILRNKKKYLFV